MQINHRNTEDTIAGNARKTTTDFTDSTDENNGSFESARLDPESVTSVPPERRLEIIRKLWIQREAEEEAAQASQRPGG